MNSEWDILKFLEKLFDPLVRIAKKIEYFIDKIPDKSLVGYIYSIISLGLLCVFFVAIILVILFLGKFMPKEYSWVITCFIIIIIACAVLFLIKLLKKQDLQETKDNITHEKVLKMIQESKPNGWEYDELEGIYTYKPDVKLTIKRIEYGDKKEYNEPWLKKFPDSVGYREIFNIFYGSSFIKKEYLIAVDGFRGYVPVPKLGYTNNPKINKWEYAFGNIIHSKVPDFYKFDDLLKRANISVVDE